MAATQINYQVVSTHFFDQIRKFLGLEFSIVIEKIGGDNKVTGTGIEPVVGIAGANTTTDLQAIGPSAEGFTGGGFIAWAELNHVTSG